MKIFIQGISTIGLILFLNQAHAVLCPQYENGARISTAGSIQETSGGYFVYARDTITTKDGPSGADITWAPSTFAKVFYEHEAYKLANTRFSNWRNCDASPVFYPDIWYCQCDNGVSMTQLS